MPDFLNCSGVVKIKLSVTRDVFYKKLVVAILEFLSKKGPADKVQLSKKLKCPQLRYKGILKDRAKKHITDISHVISVFSCLLLSLHVNK